MCEVGTRKAYPSDLSDEQWQQIAALIPEPSKEGRIAHIERRELVNAILYVLRTGCSWRQMPHDLPNGKTAHHYFRLWSKTGIWEAIMTHLRQVSRLRLGREAEPSAAIIDSQSIKTGPVRGGEKGYDAGKKIWGRKRHVLVDTLGHLLAVKVHAANLADREGAKLLLSPLPRALPRLSLLFADQGYRGEPFQDWIAQQMHWTLQLVPAPGEAAARHLEMREGKVTMPRQQTRGFQVQRKRWVVERSLAWYTRFRRLSRDYEGLTASSEAFLQIAAIRLMLSRLSALRC